MSGLGHKLDTALYRVFGRHVERRRNGVMQTRFRSVGTGLAFEEYVVRLYALSWVAFVAAATTGGYLLADVLELLAPIGVPGTQDLLGRSLTIGRTPLVLGGGLLLGGFARWSTFLASRGVLEYLARRRRTQIEHTLPGAVRYLHVLAAGTTDPRRLFEGVADEAEIHGETARSFESILAIAELTGSFETGLRQVARDTPSRDVFAPFLLTFLERSRNGPESVREFLALESRLLAVRDERSHRRESRYLASVVELFLLLLVAPVVVVLGALGVAIFLPEAPGLSLGPVSLPDLDAIVSTTGGFLVLGLGGLAVAFAFLLRPSGHRWATSRPDTDLVSILRGFGRDPADTFVVLLPVAVGAAGWVLTAGHGLPHALLAGYVTVGFPVGLVDARRARRKAAIDRQLPAFVHAVAERLDRGVPFRTAVEGVASDRDFGALHPAVARLAFDLEVGTRDEPIRRSALDRFVANVGTSLAGRTIGLAIGALEAGADARTAFAAVQSETGRLVHADRARRSRFPVVIGVGWTVALLIVVILVLVNAMVLDRAATVGAGPIQGVVVDAARGPGTASRPSFYFVTQAAMLASGWFAGVTGRGAFEGLLHSSALLTMAFLVFELAGLL